MAAPRAWTDEDVCNVAAVAAVSLHENGPEWTNWKAAWCSYIRAVDKSADERDLSNRREYLKHETERAMRGAILRRRGKEARDGDAAGAV